MKQGEKVLIFCHYIATGKALRKYVSYAMEDYVLEKGAELFNCNTEEVVNKIENLANKITNKDSKLNKYCLNYLVKLFKSYPELQGQKQDIIDAILRYMCTPSFLIRFASPYTKIIDNDWLKRSFQKVDNSGITFRQMIINFLKFLDNHKEDRDKYIEALKSIQPGGIRVKDVSLAYSDDVQVETKSDIVMANIRLCYGATKQETRQKLMKTFNTPFFPYILITSSVMAEGVDLHLNCRHIIHHDLCWNPSTLEQRTGRIDRIGAKVETSGKPIQVYLPYISETQDEKMEGVN